MPSVGIGATSARRNRLKNVVKLADANKFLQRWLAPGPNERFNRCFYAVFSAHDCGTELGRAHAARNPRLDRRACSGYRQRFAT
jgi:hypothetical protein